MLTFTTVYLYYSKDVSKNTLHINYNCNTIIMVLQGKAKHI